MQFVIDFDGTTVKQDRDYEDVKTPLEFMPGAKQALQALKAAGHTLILSSARTNRALWIDPNLDPLVQSGKKKVDREAFDRMLFVHIARVDQMLNFVAQELPDVFDAIDMGDCGKCVGDIYVDDRSLHLGQGRLSVDWGAIALAYGEGWNGGDGDDDEDQQTTGA